MIKLRNMLIAVIAITSIATAGHAGSFGVGVTGNMVSVSASGTETPGDAAGTETGNTPPHALPSGHRCEIGKHFRTPVLHPFLGSDRPRRCYGDVQRS